MLRRDASAEEIATTTGSAVQQVQLYLLKLAEFGMVEAANPAEADGDAAAASAVLPPLPDVPVGPAKWFYLDRDREIGPVAEEIILHRISAGQMQPTSMVWRAGLSRWTSYEDVHAADLADAARRGPPTAAVRLGKTGKVRKRSADDPGGLARCHVCLKHFPREQMMYYQDRWICQTCRPDFFKNLSQLGVHFRAVRRAVGRLPWRFGAWVIDVLLFGLVAKTSWILLAKAGVIEPGYFFEPRFLLAEFIGAIVWWTAFVWIGGTTPGKWALHLRVVTAGEDERAGLGAAFKRACTSFIPFGFLVAMFNPDRRALHDYLAGTRVIRWVMET